MRLVRPPEALRPHWIRQALVGTRGKFITYGRCGKQDIFNFFVFYVLGRRQLQRMPVGVRKQFSLTSFPQPFAADAAAAEPEAAVSAAAAAAAPALQQAHAAESSFGAGAGERGSSIFFVTLKCVKTLGNIFAAFSSADVRPSQLHQPRPAAAAAAAAAASVATAAAGGGDVRLKKCSIVIEYNNAKNTVQTNSERSVRVSVGENKWNKYCETVTGADFFFKKT